MKLRKPDWQQYKRHACAFCTCFLNIGMSKIYFFQNSHSTPIRTECHSTLESDSNPDHFCDQPRLLDRHRLSKIDRAFDLGKTGTWVSSTQSTSYTENATKTDVATSSIPSKTKIHDYLISLCFPIFPRTEVTGEITSKIKLKEVLESPKKLNLKHFFFFL